MDFSSIHTPVLLERCIELLAPAVDHDGAVLVDGTLGMGGHSEALLERFPRLRLIGIDRDSDALAIAGERLARFGDRFTVVHAVYDEIGDVVREHARGGVDGILLDLGVSSLQLDRAERGFAYSKDAPLDMRMDTTTGVTAAEIIATWDESELRRIFHEYGEERLAPRFARKLVEARDRAPIERSSQLVEIIAAATPAALQRTGHPAKRVFQALRIAVNGELDALERALPDAIDALTLGGRIVVMSYQSLEDRLVKRELQRRSSSTTPPGLPIELPEHSPELRLLVKGAGRASDDEIAANPRATPVRLRAAERIRATTTPATRNGA
ncbi:16S rRNA (cytosine(1402)-N(4))-methyltransferase RsmH [Herbiconiux sp. L3-i23]|uniref:16S rRNA (cytosine(1402)-N(4))-methyltransferase RsmH n=1 Tax=Herbiconiux sp. L3-i23 TaxID=2905871 RepID=UPI002053E00B|nr:16S rRNA (cytosine(1402)-N(4))-methyltransferase RsmH [Herbiconiux sp. L3-i23]BDI22396.1 ribosomal RNA small subunit methyltransferase H [Herbiconiux sp. L3-i23]